MDYFCQTPLAFNTFILYWTMQGALDRAHRVIFDPQGLSIETKMVVILTRLRYVSLPEGEMGKPHNLL
jgi:hypothetical protein